MRGLYAITPDGQDSATQLLQAVEWAIKGGATRIQYRDKCNGAAVRLVMAEALQRMCSRYGVPLIINDDVPLCRQVGAAGVHLGRDDPDIATARHELGNDRIIGVSCYNDLALAEMAQQQGADYVAFGRFFASSTKPEAVLAPFLLLQEARKKIHVPIVAIGGITLDNGQQLLACGVDSLAVIQGLFGARDVTATAKQFTQWFI